MKAWSLRGSVFLLPIAIATQACLQSSSATVAETDRVQPAAQQLRTAQRPRVNVPPPSPLPPAAPPPPILEPTSPGTPAAPSATNSAPVVDPAAQAPVLQAPTLQAPQPKAPAAPKPLAPGSEPEAAELDVAEPDVAEPETAPTTAALRRLVAAPAGLGFDEQIYGAPGMPADRDALLQAVDHSLAYLDTAKAAEAYANYPVAGVTRDRVRRSLRRFKALVQNSSSAEALQTAVRQEFDFYQATGTDGRGNVDFTGYFTPTYAASRVPTADYRYPLYAKPADLDSWPEPHPDRIALEGRDGLKAADGPLKGQELVWLKSRLEAFLVQVQGSARLQLTDGSTMAVGYAGRTNYPYVSIGKELVNDGVFTLEELTLPLMLDHFRRNPKALSDYIPRNPRFVFFKQTDGAPPMGSIAQPVTADRSIATDKSLMPPGALTLISTQIPYANPGAVLSTRRYPKRAVNRFALDQDTGGAIKGAGRADIFLGTGSVAGDRAGLVNDPGQLYYLLLKDGR